MRKFLNVVAIAAIVISVAAGKAESQTPTALPYPAGQWTGVVATNNNRVIAGYAVNFRAYLDSHYTEDLVTTGLIWRQGQFEELRIAGYKSSCAFGLNNSDVVAGAVYGTGGDSRPAVWIDGTGKVLPTLGGNGAAYDINDAGDVVGWVDSPSAGTQAAIWKQGNLSVLPSLDTGSAEALAISDDGVIFGLARVPGQAGGVPVQWVNGVISILPVSFGEDFVGDVVIRKAQAGVATGYVFQSAAQPDGSFRYELVALAWENGQFRMLERPTGQGSSYGYGVNRIGQIAGSVEGAVEGGFGETVPVIWSKEGPNQLPSRPGSDTLAVALNDLGFVVGIDRTDRLSPVPVFWDLSQTTALQMADVAAAPSQTVTLRATASLKGQPQAGQQIAFSVNGQAIGNAVTNSQGQATVGYKVPAQPSSANLRMGASRAGSPSALRSVIVGKSQTTLALTPVVARSGQMVTLSANLRLAAQNTPLSGKSVSFFMNGRLVAKAVTDRNGVARSRVAMASATMPLEVRYAGDTRTLRSASRATAFVWR